MRAETSRATSGMGAGRARSTRCRSEPHRRRRRADSDAPRRRSDPRGRSDQLPLCRLPVDGGRAQREGRSGPVLRRSARDFRLPARRNPPVAARPAVSTRPPRMADAGRRVSLHDLRLGRRDAGPPHRLRRGQGKRGILRRPRSSRTAGFRGGVPRSHGRIARPARRRRPADGPAAPGGQGHLRCAPHRLRRSASGPRAGRNQERGRHGSARRRAGHHRPPPGPVARHREGHDASAGAHDADLGGADGRHPRHGPAQARRHALRAFLAAHVPAAA
jgi:hypothetical protein